jgi:hypothetical protein
MVDYLDQKMEHKQACETPSSTSSTTESGQIEDVEIIVRFYICFLSKTFLQLIFKQQIYHRLNLE